MKSQYLSVLVLVMMLARDADAAEVYNKDGNRLDLYGKLKGMRYISSDDDQNSDYSVVRYGFRGKTQINDRLVGFGIWEHEFGLHNAESNGMNNIFIDLSFAGIKFDNDSSIDYGRNYGILHDISVWTDIMPEFGRDISVTDNFLSGPANGVFTYRNTNFFGMINGLHFALQYQGKNDSNKGNVSNNGLQKTNGNGYGLSFTYDLGNGISAGGAVSNSNLTLSQRSSMIEHNQGKKAGAYACGVKYNIYDLYMAAMYSETRNMTPYVNFSSGLYNFAEKAHNFVLVAKYQFDFGLSSSFGYLQSHIDRNHNDKGYDITKYLEIGASYNFNKNMISFVDYRINLLPQGDFTRSMKISTDNIVALGITYTL